MTARRPARRSARLAGLAVLALTALPVVLVAYPARAATAPPATAPPATTPPATTPPAAALGAPAPGTPGPMAARPARSRPAAQVRPSRQLFIRPKTIDVVADGRTVDSVPRPESVIDVSWLVGHVPARWVSAVGASTVRVSAEIVLGRGAILEVGPRTDHLQLAGGADPREASGISVASGLLLLQRATVASRGSSGGLVAPGLAGRPWISVGNGGRAQISDTVISGLGTGAGSRSAGLFLGPGSTASVARSTFENNGVGLVLSRARGVALDGVTIGHSVADGLSLRNDTGTSLRGVTSSGNGRDGVSVSGTDHRVLAGVRTWRNHRYGVRAAELGGLTVVGGRSSGDGAALALTGCRACTVRDLESAGGAAGLVLGGRSGGVTVVGGVLTGATTGLTVASTVTGVRVRGVTVQDAGSTGLALCGTGLEVSGVTVASRDTGIEICGHARGVEISTSTVWGASTGLRATGAARGVSVHDSTVTGHRDAAVRLSASGVSLTDVQIEDSATGVNIYGHARGTTLDELTVRAGRSGVVAGSGTSGVTLTDVSLQVSGIGISSGGTGLSVRSATIRGGDIGLNLRGEGQLRGLTLTGVRKGVKVNPHASFLADQIDVLATKVGIRVQRRGSFTLTDSRVRAPQAVVGRVARHGHNTITLPPFPWLGFAALGAVAIALSLEITHRVRAGRSRKTVAPDHVLNTA
jgi:hypothetical protein